MYELVFWKYQEGIYLNHQVVYEALADEQEVIGLEVLPIAIIFNRIHSVFSKWEKVDDNSWKNGMNSIENNSDRKNFKSDDFLFVGKSFVNHLMV